MCLLVCQPQIANCSFAKSNTSRGSTKPRGSDVARRADNARGADRAGISDHPRVGRMEKGQGSNLAFGFSMGSQCGVVAECLGSLSCSSPDCILGCLVSCQGLRMSLRSGSTSDQKQKGRNGEDESEHFVAKKAKFALVEVEVEVEVAMRTVTTSSGLTAQPH